MAKFGLWDVVLIAVVAIQAGILTYVSDPRKKSLILVFPFPFTCATISLGGKIDATNVLGLLNLALFTYGVRFFYSKLKMNIVFSIVFFALLYCFLAIVVAKILPDGEIVFWISTFFVAIFAISLALLTDCPVENSYRTDLHPLIKIPVIVGVISTLVLLKKQLSGFMTVFPMVGVIAAYESRFMLASVCRQLPVLMICLVSLMMTLKIVANITNFWIGLISGWIVFLIVLKITGRFLWEQLCLKKLNK
ncbi:MAG: hypothetical protein ACPL3Q_01760 [Candidatus Ratteibacteria bacterium]